MKRQNKTVAPRTETGNALALLEATLESLPPKDADMHTWIALNVEIAMPLKEWLLVIEGAFSYGLTAGQTIAAALKLGDDIVHLANGECSYNEVRHAVGLPLAAGQEHRRKKNRRDVLLDKTDK